MSKTYATAQKIESCLDRIQNEEAKKKIIFDIEQTKWLGAVYLPESSDQVKEIEKLGFRLRKKGKYYELRRN